VLVQFPGHIEVSGHRLSLSYRFCPGDETDGVTVKIPSGILATLSPEPFEWLVPGLLQEKITYLLKSLPRQIRKNLVPISRVAENMGKGLKKTEKGLLRSLQEELFRQYGIRIERKMWPSPEDIPPHLLMRFDVLDQNGKVIDSGCDLNRLQETWKRTASIFNQNDPEWLKIKARWEVSGLFNQNDPEWLKIKARWEVSGLNLKDLPDIPSSVTGSSGDRKSPVQAFPGLVAEDNSPDIPSSVTGSSGDRKSPVQAFPGLVAEDNSVCIRLFLNQDEAVSETRQGASRLLAD